MKMSQAFPTKYLKAADLENKQWTVTIKSVVREEGIDKPIMYFQEAERGMALNKTNAMMIAAAYGDDSNTWEGRPIKLYQAMVSFNNNFVPAIRVMTPAPEQDNTPPRDGRQDNTPPFGAPNAGPDMSAHGAAPRPVHPAPSVQGGPGIPRPPLDDDIPF